MVCYNPGIPLLIPFHHALLSPGHTALLIHPVPVLFPLAPLLYFFQLLCALVASSFFALSLLRPFLPVPSVSYTHFLLLFFLPFTNTFRRHLSFFCFLVYTVVSVPVLPDVFSSAPLHCYCSPLLPLLQSQLFLLSI